MVWPTDFSNSAATMRVTWSVDPPAAQGTIRLIGRTGFQSAAPAAPGSATSEAASNRAARRHSGCFKIFIMAVSSVFMLYAPTVLDGILIWASRERLVL